MTSSPSLHSSGSESPLVTSSTRGWTRCTYNRVRAVILILIAGNILIAWKLLSSNPMNSLYEFSSHPVNNWISIEEFSSDKPNNAEPIRQHKKRTRGEITHRLKWDPEAGATTTATNNSTQPATPQVPPDGARQPFQSAEQRNQKRLKSIHSHMMKQEDQQQPQHPDCHNDYNAFEFPIHGCSISSGSKRPHCALLNVKIHPDRIHSQANAGAPLKQVMGQSEQAEYVSYDKGAFEVTDDPHFVSLNKDVAAFHYLSLALESVQVTTGKQECIETWPGTTLLVVRYEYVNLYHTMTDWWNSFMSMPDDSSKSEQPAVNVLFLDAHPQGNLDDTWKILFGGKVKYAQHLPHATCLENARFVPVGYTSPLFPRSRREQCVSTHQMSAFVDFLVSRHGLSDVPKIPGRVVVLDRVPYVSHPRSDVKKAQRTLGNLRENAKQLPSQAKSATPLDVQVHTMIDMTIQEQIQVIREASIVIANHGAGLTHLMWLHDDAHVIELSCTKNFFRELVKWLPNIHHHCQPPVQNHISDPYWKQYVVTVVQDAIG